MNALFAAIWSIFEADKLSGFYLAIDGRMYLKVAPQNTTRQVFPYCVFDMITDDNDVDFSDEREEFEIQFNIFSLDNSGIEAGTLLESLKEMFDNATLTVTGWNALDFKRQRVLSNDDFSQVPPINGYSVMYDVLIERLNNC